MKRSYRVVVVAALLVGAMGCHHDGDGDGGNENDADVHDSDRPTEAGLDAYEHDARDAESANDASMQSDGMSMVDAVTDGAASDDCTNATTLTPGTLLSQHTPTSGIASAQCRPSDAPQRFYSFVLPGSTRATITITPTGPWRAVGRVLEYCSATSCLSDAQSDSVGSPVRLVIDSPNTAPLTKIVSVSGLTADSGGEFTITLQLDAVSAQCAAPVVRALTVPNDTASGSLWYPGGSLALSCTDPTLSGAEAIYSLHVDARTALEFEADCSRIDCGVAIRTACTDASTDVGCNSTPMFRLYGLLRTVLDPGDYFVVVDGATRTVGTTEDGTYVLNVRPFDPAPNYACGAAIPLTSGVPLLDQHLAGGGSPDTTCGVDGTPAGGTDMIGEVLYYRVEIPAGEVLVAAIDQHSGPSGLRFIARNDCTPESCAIGGVTESRLVFENTSSTARSLIIGVTAILPLMGADAVFDVTARIGPHASNATCAAATLVTDGTHLVDQDTAFGTIGQNATRALYYAADVPAGQKLTLTHGAQSGGCEPGFCFLTACGSQTCLASDDALYGRSYTNTSGASQHISVAVMCTYNSGPEPLDLTFAIGP